jgi:hypothetical protein
VDRARKLLLTLGGATAALVLAGSASADRGSDRPIVVRAVAVPTFVDATPECPAFSAKEQMQSPSGAPLGWFEFCFSTFSQNASGGDTDTGIATFHFRDGAVETTLTLDEVPTATGVIQTDTGTIFAGTGIYRGATGALSGGGPIDFDSTGTPHPDLMLTLTLGRSRGVPLRAVDTGTAVGVPAGGSVIETTDTGSGRATHLGRYTLAAGEHVDLASGAITGGFYTLTTATGDTITGTYSGEALPGLTGYLVSGPVTGGTGRFAGATGFLVWRGTVDPTALTFSDVVTGWIAARSIDDEGSD